MTESKEYNPYRYENHCYPMVSDPELNNSAREIYNAYGADSTIEGELFEMLSEYITSKGFIKQIDTCYRTFTKPGFDKVLVIRRCQNYIYEIEDNEILKGDEDDILEYVCYGENDIRRNVSWIEYLYMHNYPRDEIIDLINKAKIIIRNTPDEYLGDIEEN